MIVISHPTGNTFVRAMLGGLSSGASGPFEFHTSLGVSSKGDGSPVRRLIAPLVGRRTYPVSAVDLYQHPYRELIRLFAGRLGWSGLTKHETGWASVDAVYHSLDRAVA